MKDEEEAVYQDFAEVYDYFYQRIEDINFYVEQAKKFGSPILELACGTGRVLLEIAKKGFAITGLDMSDAMLNILRKKLEKENENVQKNVDIVKGDMRNFALDRKFNLIIVPFSSIVHLLTLDDALKAFKCVYNHLNKDGAFIFDTFTPNLELLAKKRRVEFDIRDIDGNGTLAFWEVASYDLTNQLITVKRYGFVETDNRKKKFMWRFKIRYWFKSELELLLKLAGFGNIAVFGGFDLRPYCYESGMTLFIAKIIP